MLGWLAGGAAAVAAFPLALLALMPTQTPAPAAGGLDASKVPAQYVAAINAASATCEDAPPALLAAQLYSESRFDPNAVSPVGAQGIAQVMPDTWAAHGVDANGDGVANPFDPVDGIFTMAAYDCAVAADVASVPGDPTTNMLAAYNAGPGAVLKYQGVPPYAETQAYVQRIMSLAGQFAAPVTAAGPSSDLRRFPNGQIPLPALCPIAWAPGQMTDCAAASPLVALNNHYRATFGRDLCITDSYRSYAAQVDVFARKPALAAVPGTSNHGWGVALDLCDGVQTFGTVTHEWMRTNAGTYGWVHPKWAQRGGSRPEPWHWEYVGAASP